MASTSGSGFDNNTPLKNRDINSSTYQQTVCLQDWWLIKAEKEFEGKILAVGGLALREQRAARVFSSAPIIKRYDIFTLKTADGITILIKGKINISRTRENGVPSEVYSHFTLGFPYNWESYADKCFDKELKGKDGPTRISGFDEVTMSSYLPDCLGGEAVTQTLNHLISSFAASVSSMLTKNVDADVLEKSSGHDLESPTGPIFADGKSSSPGMGDSLPEETPIDKEKSKSEQNHGHVKGPLHAIEEEMMDNEDDLLSNKQENLNNDGCNNDPESEVVKENTLEERFEISTEVPILHMSTEVVKSSDMVPCATKGTFIGKEDGVHEKTTMENEGNISSDEQDYLNNDCSYEPGSKVLDENSFKEKLENSNDNIPVLHLNAEVINSSAIEPLATNEALTDKDGGSYEPGSEVLEDTSFKEKVENSNDNIPILPLNAEVVNSSGIEPLASNEALSNKDGGSYEPGSEVLEDTSFKEKLENSNDNIPVLHLNAEVVNSSDIEPLATNEALFDKDGGINEEIMENEDNLLSVNLNKIRYNGCHESQSEVLKENTDDLSVFHLNAGVVKPSDIDRSATKEILVDKEDGRILTLSNISKRTTRSSVKNLRNSDVPSDEHSVPTDSDLTLSPSMVGTSASAGNLSTWLSEGFMKSGNNRQDKVRAVGSLKSKRTKLCSSVLQHNDADMVSLTEVTDSAGGNSNFHKDSFDGILEMHASKAPNVDFPKFSSNIRKCNNNLTEEDVSRTHSTSIASVVKDDNPSKVNMVLPVDLNRSSEKLKSSKCSQKVSNKAKRSLRSEGSENLSCYDTGKVDSSKDASASIGSEVEISSNNETTLSNVGGGVTNKKRGRPRKKRENSSSVSELKGCVVVPGLRVEQKVTRGSSVGVEQILEESLSKTTYFGSPETSDRAGNCSHRTMEDSTAWRNLESNLNCSTEKGSDTINVTREVNAAAPVDISSTNTTTLSNVSGGVTKQKQGRPRKKRENFSSVSGFDSCVVGPGLTVEQKLTHGSSVGVEQILEESQSKTTYVGSPEISDGAGNCSPLTMEDSTARRNLESNLNWSTEMGTDTINVTPNKGAATRTSNRFKNIESEGGKITASNSCIKDKNNVCTATSEVIEKPGRKHLTGSCALNPSSSFKEIGSLSDSRRTSSRLKNLSSKEEKPSDRGLEFKGNKVNSVLMGPNFVKGDVDKVDCEPGGRSSLEQPKVGLHATLSSVPSGAVEKVNSASVSDGSECGEQSKSRISSIMLGNMKQTSHLDLSMGREDSKHNTSGRKTKRKQVLSSPVTRNKKMKLCLASPEDLSLKRSKSGRLLVPPLDFWRNQQVVYGGDGQIAGVQESLPILESSAGSKSEPPKAKRKLL